MIIYNTTKGLLLEKENQFYLHPLQNWGEFINDDNLSIKCLELCNAQKKILNGEDIFLENLLKPVDHQEIWASGVTYFNSKLARQAESQEAGGADFYARVYTADRPELFFKSTAERTVGHRANVKIRKDSSWSVPEPELTLFVTSNQKIVGYTIGNDMSSRSIEGENPLYLPQAKTYDQSAAIGPGIFVSNGPFPNDAEIRLEIRREQQIVFSGHVRVSDIVRAFEDLVDYLFAELSFPSGCFLMTGTGVVPPAEFTLHKGDEIAIDIDHIGRLINFVA